MGFIFHKLHKTESSFGIPYNSLYLQKVAYLKDMA